MKRIVSILLVIVLLTGTAYALYAEKANFPIFVNGEELYCENPPLAYNGRSYLSIRSIADAVGVKAEWKNNRVEIETIDIETLKDSCVMVRGGDVKGTYIEQASGVIIDYDEILTVNHVADHQYFAIHYDDSTAFNHCTLSDFSESQDAAILEPEFKNVKPVQIGDSDTVKVGNKVWVVSCPDGRKNEVVSGYVTNLNNINQGYSGYRISCSTSSGSSGGAVFNADGELIGTINAGDGTSAFMIPINQIRKDLAA
jgi:S1-C subfamily serine protease